MIFERDIQLDADGDLDLSDGGDIKIAGPVKTAVQDITFRLQTQANDFLLHPLIGANLQQFYGKHNTRATGEAIRRSVYRALTRDGRFVNSGIEVEVVPVSSEEVIVMVGIIDTVLDAETNDTITASFLLSYNTGDITVMR